MILAVIALLLSSHPYSVTTVGAPAGDTGSRQLASQGAEQQKEYEQRKKAAGKDVAALWELYLWCDTAGMAKEARACLRSIVKADPNHTAAHERLGHLSYDGKWFTSEKELEKYKGEQEERIAKEKGLVKHNGSWVPAQDVPFLERGLIRGDDGQWVTAEESEKLKSGWVRQDLEWVSPEEKPNVEKGLWKCGDKWLELSEANGYHSEPDRWWRIPGERFLLHTTCDREVAKKALEAMHRAYRDLVRIFGAEPDTRVAVVLLRDTPQYNAFAAGMEGERPAAELRALSSIHHAYFADAWFDPVSHEFMGAGVALWDASTEAGSRFGPHAVRYAAAQAFIEAIDPSPKTSARGVKSGGFTEKDAADFWGEKKLPEWLRSGAACYVERYFVDHFIAQGGNPYWAREWSVQNIVSRGGPRPLSQVFEGHLSVQDPEGSSMLLNERGLIIAFVLDGECAPVIDAHGALKEAILGRKDLGRPIDKLMKVIQEHDAELRAFAGL